MLVWRDCDWHCFSARKYQVLKDGFVTEINQYRRLHNALPLIENHCLNKFATEYAWGSCLNDSIAFKCNHKIGYLGLHHYIAHANIIIKNMYDKFILNYDWNQKHHEGKYDKYAQLIWNSTRKIGFGFCFRYGDIQVVIAFSPRGCTGYFDTNVQPIGSKHIHMFGVFGKNFGTNRAE